MKHLALALLITLPLASAASAFSIDITPPRLDFPTASTPVASQACIQPATLHLRCN
jgi:P pilus assembly chaperone PapD